MIKKILMFFLIILIVFTLIITLNLKEVDISDEGIVISEDVNTNDLTSNNENKFTLFSPKYQLSREVLNETQLQYVAHACGKTSSGTTASNTLDAFVNTLESGYKLIEADISWTSDNVPVIIHDWYYALQYFYEIGDLLDDITTQEEIDNGISITYEEFKNLKLKNGLKQFSLDELMQILKDKKYQDVYLITDTKKENEKLLKYISENYRDMMRRIIPQVYNQEEYHIAKKLGFEDIIYTLYLSHDTMEQVINFSYEYKPYAITMDTTWAYSELPLRLSEIGTYTYTHTLNDENEFEYLKTNGIKGIYTDILLK